MREESKTKTGFGLGSHSNTKCIFTTDFILFCVPAQLRLSWISKFLCDLGKKGADHPSRARDTFCMICMISSCPRSLNDLLLTLTLYLCLCSSFFALAAQAWKLLAALFLPYSRAQQGLAPPGSDPHTLLARCIHLLISWISRVLSCLSSSLLCVPCLIFGSG